MKKNVKLILLSAIGALSVFSATTLTSCKSDKCKAIACQYGGVCTDDGACQCQPGYEGTMCEVETRKKYVGTWNVLEQGTISHKDQFITTIQHSNAIGASVAQVQITNLNNSFSSPVNATLKGDTLIIPEQTIDNKTVVGIGFLYNDDFYGEHGKFVLRYKVTYNDVKDENDFGYVIGQPSEWHK